MKRLIAVASIPLALAGCVPADGDNTSDKDLAQKAIDACARPDVQDVVGKDVRNRMLKANIQGVMIQSLFGQDAIAEMEQARVSFSDVGVYSAHLPQQSTVRQVICGASLQIDSSSARSGQEIVTIPHLRWSINFTQPTEDPSTEGFTVEVDEVSIGNGLLLNGKPPAQPSQYQDVAAPEDDTASAPQARAYLSPEEQADAAAAAADARKSAAEAEADAKAAASF